jgi:hypothetical protein
LTSAQLLKLEDAELIEQVTVQLPVNVAAVLDEKTLLTSGETVSCRAHKSLAYLSQHSEESVLVTH